MKAAHHHRIPPVETYKERRLRKLKTLCAAKGGYVVVAETAGIKPVYLDQILKGTLLPPKKGEGTRNARALGDEAVEKMENAFSLGRGWFDTDEEEATMTPKELQLIGLFRELDNELQDIVLSNVREVIDERIRMIARAKRPVQTGEHAPPSKSTKPR